MSRLDDLKPISPVPPPDPSYPDDDGNPLSENTLQFRFITTIVGGLKAQYREHPNVFIAGDLLWYPVQGQRNLNQAPDVMVVFGRPKGERTSYLQWREDNRPPQVTFEIASQSNTQQELEVKKLNFYQRYGVQEYYVFYPLRGRLRGWQRQGDQLIEIPQMQGWESPRLQLRFEQEGKELYLFDRKGERLRDYPEVIAELEQTRQERDVERQRAELAETQGEQYRQQLEAEQQQSQQYRQQLEAEQQQSQQYRQEIEAQRQRIERAVTGLLAVGFSVEQIAETLSLPLTQVTEIANRSAEQ
jgi:Uma2 family endonuclease